MNKRPLPTAEAKEDVSPTQLGIFAKFWAPGQVKTRLAVSIGDELAATLHRTHVATLVQRFESTADVGVLAISPWEQRRAFEMLVAECCCQSTDGSQRLVPPNAPCGWRIQPQSSGDLGSRMRHYFDKAFSSGSKRVVLIGSDSPTISDGVLQRAFDSLQSHDVVLGPAEDGGYYLVGARHHTPPIFGDIAWGTSSVLEKTMQCVKAGGLSLLTLATGYDVDRVDDLTRLQRELQGPNFAEPFWNALKHAVDEGLRNRQ